MRLFARVLVALVLSTSAASAQDAVALYEVIFDSTWSAETHPTAVPPNPHFSTPVAASHDESVAFWLPGGLATQGIEDMAEKGATSPLTLEMQSAVDAGSARDWVTAGGEGMFLEVSQSHPLASFVSMVAPSPDWFVGVTGVALFEDGAWLDELSFPLYAWDAGTDLGADFLSADIDQEPQAPIAFSERFEGTPALGTVTFRRVASGAPCYDGLDQDDDGSVDYPADPGCTSPVDLAETEPGLPCDDGLDNDGDGFVDSAADPGCRDANGPTESPQCQDGLDNDGAAGIDFDGGASVNGGVALAAADPQCTAPWRSQEAASAPAPAPACGIGPELAAGVGALLWLCRRRPRAHRTEAEKKSNSSTAFGQTPRPLS
jgi:hypothetical protein